MKIAHHLAHTFLPHHTNNHRAKVLHPSAITLLAISLIIFQLGLQLVGKIRTPSGQVLGYAANISVDEVVRLTNLKRAEAGLPTLKVNPNLSKGAYAKGQYMLEKDFWAHVAPDGTQPWKFFGDVGYKYRYAGENLARDFSNPSSAIDAWMASPTHKENMLSPKYQEIGIGIVEGDLAGVDTTIIVQFFGTAIADTIPITPVAEASGISTSVAEATPEPTPVVSLAAASPVPHVLISPFNTTRSVSLALVGVLMAALIIDVVIVSRRRIARASSRSIAHIAFLGMLIAIILIVRAGQII